MQNHPNILLTVVYNKDKAKYISQGGNAKEVVAMNKTQKKRF